VCGKSAYGKRLALFGSFYLATIGDSVVVIHTFQKKAQQTPQKDIELAASRLRTGKG
jgi:phage-related protein